MKELNKKYEKLKELLENEFNNDMINYNDVNYDKTENEYAGVIDICGECKIFCNLDNNNCMLSFTDISFDVYYTTDDIRSLCKKLDDIAEMLS